MPAHWPPTRNDALGQTERWTLSGVTSTYSDRGSFYVAIAASTIDVYSDIDLGSGQKVATGSHSQPTTWTKITLSAANTSGLTGSVYLKYQAATSTAIRVYPTLATDAELQAMNVNLASWPMTSGLTFEAQHQKTRADFVRLCLQRFPPVFAQGSRITGTLRGQLSDIWRVNSVGDYEMVRLQNIEDYDEWSWWNDLATIYATPNRILPQEEQQAMARDARERADAAFAAIIPRVDVDMDGDSDGELPRFRLARG